MMDTAYQVRVSKWFHALSLFFTAGPVLIGAVMWWAYAVRDRAELDTWDNDLLVLKCVSGVCLLIVLLLEYYIFRVRLFVITPKYEYAYRPFIGSTRFFNAQEVGSMDVGGSLLQTMVHGNVLTLYDHEKRILCRLDFTMKNSIRFRDELYAVLRERNIANYMVDDKWGGISPGEAEKTEHKIAKIFRL